MTEVAAVVPDTVIVCVTTKPSWVAGKTVIIEFPTTVELVEVPSDTPPPLPFSV
jgi:hypothetical protein